MRARTLVIGIAMVVVAATGCARTPGPVTAAPSSTTSPMPSSTVTSERSATPSALPAGWRWESYGGVEVGVPNSWGWTNGSQRIGQWCVSEPKVKPDRTPAVGRPGVSTQAGCDAFPQRGKPDPATLLKNTGPVVAFEHPEKPKDRFTNEGDRTTVVLNGIEVIVQTEPALRRRILATVHAVTVDVNGCPMTDPVSREPGRRPSPPVGVSKLRAVSAVSACKYTVGQDAYRSDPRLQSSLRLAGAKAATAVDRIAAASTGGGPDESASCPADYSYGEELIVLRVTSKMGRSQIYLRYAGCTTTDSTTDARFVASTRSPSPRSSPAPMLSTAVPVRPPPGSSGRTRADPRVRAAAIRSSAAAARTAWRAHRARISVGLVSWPR